MPRARKHLVSLSETPYYHITSRCVRRAFLCGSDQFTGKDYEHRRQWVEDRLRVLSSLFCIDICAYAVMSNHYHLVIKISPEQADDWSEDEVLMRWTALFRGPILVQQYLAGDSLDHIELETVRTMTEIFRTRLQSLSWFMKCLNEPIARKANAEDRCTGHFWEARFHSESLCSDQALIAAMAYVDLNPIRAKMARTPETSNYTSIKTRIQARDEKRGTQSGKDQHHRVNGAITRMLETGKLRQFNVPVKQLKAFSDVVHASRPATPIECADNNDRLPIYREEYFKLVDTTGRILVRGKSGRIDPELAPVLERLNLSTQQWLKVSTGFRQFYQQGHLRLSATA